VLQRVLDGRVTFTPRRKGDGYDFSASTRFDRLFAGVVIPPPDGDYSDLVKHAGKGTERIDRRRDTLEGDYADGLERATEALKQKPQKSSKKRNVKGDSSPTGFGAASAARSGALQTGRPLGPNTRPPGEWFVPNGIF
jgi:hypothetical protein